MEVIYSCCCGVDVHAKMLAACIIKQGKKQIRTFSTMTKDILRLLDWLMAEGCTHLAIESTGVYWKPVFNILEGFIEVILVNAQHVKAVPGRKTDVRDCEWLADLLRHGLLKASFIPPINIREIRELIRYRESLVREQANVANRIQKLIESANIKLGQVASDVLGISGKAILQELASGETDVEKMSQLALKRLKNKKEELKLALEGKFTAAQRWILKEQLVRYKEIEEALDRVAKKIDEEIENNKDDFVSQAVVLLQTIPGIGKQSAQTIISEIGVNMKRFPTANHLASWAGICPGNNESAGKRKSGKTNKGSPYLRTALVQSAWAATHTKNTYLSAQYYKLVKRMGRKKALVAVAHSILIMVYHILDRKRAYQELGGDYFDKQNVELQRKRLIHRLEALGLEVIVSERAA